MTEGFINSDRAIVTNDQSAKVAEAKPGCVPISNGARSGQRSAILLRSTPSSIQRSRKPVTSAFWAARIDEHIANHFLILPKYAG